MSFVFGPYWDGEKQVFGDPGELWRNLVGHARGCLDQLIRDSKVQGPSDSPADDEATLANKQELRNRANAVAFPAIARMMEVARLTFDLLPFDKSTGKGATEKDCDAVLTAFFKFRAEQKKNIDG